MNKIRIAFSGIGAVGGYYGGTLAAKYHDNEFVDVFFVSRGETLRIIKERGLRISNNEQIQTVHPTLATDNPAEIGPVDYLFCCTKSYNLRENLLQLQPLLAPETIIIPLLNGIDIAEQIRAIFPEQTVWRGCTYIGSRQTEPGLIVKFSEKEKLIIGMKDADNKRLKEISDILIPAHINVYTPKDIDAEIWRKFMMISPAAAITSFYNQNISKAIEEHNDLFLALGNELVNIAKAKGIDLPKEIIYSSVEAQKMMPPDSTTSMHADFLAGKPTETENLIGYVVRTADELGINTPAYQFIYKGLTEFPNPFLKE